MYEVAITGPVLPLRDSGMLIYRLSWIIGEVFGKIHWSTETITPGARKRNSTDTKNFRPSWAEHAQLLSLPQSFSLALEKSFDRLIRYRWIDQYSNTSLY